MSATGRSDVRDSADYYATPAFCVRRLLERVQLPGGPWLEPCAGEGAVIKAVNELRSDVDWTAVEYRPECLKPLHALNLNSVQIDSFTTLSMPLRRAHFAVCLSNPPYRSALPFVQRACELADIVVFLLRLNWLAGRERHAWLMKHVPNVYVLPDRPSFVDGGTDATDYAWMLWHREENVAGVIEVLATTPAEERRGSPDRESAQLSLLGDVA